MCMYVYTHLVEDERVASDDVEGASSVAGVAGVSAEADGFSLVAWVKLAEREGLGERGPRCPRSPGP